MKANQQHLVDGKYTLPDLVDIDRLREVLEHFSQATGFTTGLISYPGQKVLIATGWRDICIKFHRAFPASAEHCRHSKHDLTSALHASTERNVRHCRHGLVEGATPIIIKGVHVADLFTGQVLFQKPDRKRFKKQAEQYGYDVKAYLRALDQVPIVTAEAFQKVLSFLSDMAVILAEQGLKEVEIRAERKKLAGQKQRLDYIIQGTNVGTWDWNVQTGELVFNKRWADMIGCTLEELAPISIDTMLERTHPDDLQRGGELLQKCFEGKTEFYEYEVRMRHKNGEWIWVLDRGKVGSWTEDGRPLWMYGTHQDITPRKQAETSLRESEQRFRQIFEGSRDGFVMVDTSGGITEANPAFCKMLGYSLDELRAMNDFYRITPERWHQWEKEEIWERLLQNGYSGVYEKEYIRKNGTVFAVELQSYTVFDNDGQALYLWGIAREITERKRAEKALARSEKRLRSITENAPDFIFVKDDQRRYTFVNRAMQHLLNRPAEEILEKTPEEVFGPEQGKIIREVDDRAFGGENVNIVRKLVMGDSERYFHTVQTPLEVNKDRVTAIMGIVRDITELKETENALQTSEENLRTTLDSIGDAVISTDLKGRIVRMNPVAQYLTGWTMAEARGISLKEVFTVLDDRTREPAPDPVMRVLTNDEIVGPFSHTLLIARNGAEYRIEESAAPIRNKTGQTTGAVLVFRDITEKLRHEQELQRMQKLQSLGTVAGGIAHDFNNLIMGVFGNIEMARMVMADDHEANPYLKEAYKALESARRLTGQLLTFARGGNPVLETVDLKELVQETVAFNLSGSNIRPEFHLPENLWPIQADPGQLGQVLANLTINAKQAMTGGGRLHIGGDNLEEGARSGFAHLSGPCVQLTIRDEGTGISPEIVDRIFDPYFSTKQSGNGLGLAVVHSIVTKHQGHIRVTSTPDAGTTFTLFLPTGFEIENLPSRAAGDPPKEPAPVSLHILLMDDEALIRRTTTAMLQKFGHSVDTTSDGTEALAKYATASTNGTPYDLVIMDLTIPGGKGGRETVRELLQLDPRARVIVASGYSSDPVLAGYQDHGFCGRLTKPFQIQELNREVQRVMGKTWNHQRNSE